MTSQKSRSPESFELLEKLGEGAMGTVYEAVHPKIGKRAAVKILRPEFAMNREYAARFLAEAQAVNIVEHPGLVSIFEFGQKGNDCLFIVMDYLSGKTLEAVLEQQPRGLPLPVALDALGQVARALAAAHARGVVHRDLKPRTISLVEKRVESFPAAPMRSGEWTRRSRAAAAHNLVIWI